VPSSPSCTTRCGLGACMRSTWNVTQADWPWPLAPEPAGTSNATTDGNIADSTVAAQLAVMNAAYGPAGVQFVLSSTDRTTNATWYNIIQVTLSVLQLQTLTAVRAAAGRRAWCAAFSEACINDSCCGQHLTQ